MEDLTLSLGQEFGRSNFGDARLSKRLSRISDAALRAPSESLPEIVDDESDLEGTYRFLNNEKVTPEGIISGHVQATLNRCLSEDRLVIAHDTTDFLLGGRSRSEEIGFLNQSSVGFIGHFALAVSRRQNNVPLGVLGFETLFRDSKSTARKESSRWWSLAQKTESLFPDNHSPVHVMDRGADDYALYSSLVAENIRFVIRLRMDRNECRVVGASETAKLYTCLRGLEVIAEREVFLSVRTPKRRPKERKDHPPRSSRKAKLHITAASLSVPRPPNLSHDSRVPKDLSLNVVHVREVDFSDNCFPVDWKLITREPISSAEDVLNIVDDYRARWMIEEFFKALKTGCAYEKRQLENRRSLLNTLAVFAPIAWQLLFLRTLNQFGETKPAKCALTKVQIRILQTVPKKPIPAEPTVKDALYAIARLGGHIKHNGPPGWIVLSRGMEKLLTMEVAWTAALEEGCDQS